MKQSEDPNRLNKNPFLLRMLGMGRSYFVKTPWWLKKFYSDYIWEIPAEENVLYLTFDDGPDPEVTLFVLDQLREYNAKATFFCIGNNVVDHPETYQRVLFEGHQVGNHTYDHLNGWETKTDVYLKGVMEAAKHIDSPLFRPPYGRITSFQAKYIPKALNKEDAKIIMWTVLSGDFDLETTNEQCLHHVILNASKGSIIVFHDSQKAFPKLRFALPVVLKHFSEKGFRFESLIGKALEKREEKIGD